VAGQHYIPPPNAENRELLLAMARAAQREDDWPSRRHIYRQLLKSVLLLPVAELPRGIRCGETLSTYPMVLQFGVGVNPNGEKWVAIFTGEEALREWDTVEPFIRADTRAILKMMLEGGIDVIYVNPFRERPKYPGKVLVKSEFEMLAGGIIPVTFERTLAEMRVAPGSAMTIEGPIDRLPNDILDALHDAAKGLRGLREIYHFRLSIKGGPPHDALAIRCGIGIFPMSQVKVAKALMSRVQPLLGKGSLDVIFTESVGPEALKKANVVWRKR
jgi:hypothetical protein